MVIDPILELWDVYLEISKRYKIRVLEIGADMDHVHFLVQTVPTGNTVS